MRVDPELAEFAADRREMARAQDRVLVAREAWMERPEVARVLRDCEALGAAEGEGAELADRADLAALMAGEAAAQFVGAWFGAMARAWDATPLAQMPFRHSYTGGTAMMHLYHSGRATLALLAVEPCAAPRPRTIAFSDCERHEIVLAGQGRATTYADREGKAPLAATVPLAPGVRFRCDAENSRVVEPAGGPVLILRVAREPAKPALTREVEIATGRTVHRASASPAEGRAELAAALLGAMGRDDAAPVLARYACGKAGEGARWQALRQALVMDTATGFKALSAIAVRPDEPLAPHAGVLCDRLCTTYPQLANLREKPCLAS